MHIVQYSMAACNIEAVKCAAKYLDIPVGSLSYDSEQVLTAVVDEEIVEGFPNILLNLASKNNSMTQEQRLNIYQWLEYIALHANEALANPSLATTFLEDFNKALERNAYITGPIFTFADIAIYNVLYPMINRLSLAERQAMMHLSRWSKNVQSQPATVSTMPPLHFGALSLV